MRKVKRSFKQHLDEWDGMKKRKVKTESRHNFKDHLKHMVEDEEWDELDEDINSKYNN